MCLAAVFVISLSSLAYEVILTRIFSITQWNHLTFMVISIALFGFAFSGTVLFVMDRKKKYRLMKRSITETIPIIAVLYSVSAIVSLILLSYIPLDYFRLPFELIQAVYLLIVYMCLALPFFFAGFVISLCYAYLPEKTGSIYFMSMTGSAIGAALPFLLLPFLGEASLIVIVSVVPATLLFFNKTKKNTETERQSFHLKKRFALIPLTISLIVIIFATLPVSPYGNVLIEVKPSSYKSLSQNLKFPQTRILETKTGLRGRTDSIESAYIRFAPGLSLKFDGTLPV
ncbi:hypothetical protein ACFLZL_04650, partial [Thermodesulfobacteriota bacterium]